MNQKTNLHIFLGAGGVGKTTISASYAIYLASLGKKVGLLSIDPAKRLRSALSVEHVDEEGKIFWNHENQHGYLRAAILNLPDSLKRWIIDEGLPIEHQNQLFEHPLFRTLAEKIASATETLAPVRMAEWLEQYPDTEELIIDTAPGVHAVDFITRPEKLLAFFDSKILQWMKWFAGETKWEWRNGKKEIVQDQNFIQKFFRMGARTTLTMLGKAGGENVFISLVELILLMDQIFYKIIDRLEQAKKWIRSENTKIYFVFSLREDSISVVLDLKRILEENQISPNQFNFILNKSISDEFLESEELKNFLKHNTIGEVELLFKSYILSFPRLKQIVYQKLENSKIFQIKEIPITSSLTNINQKEMKFKDLLEIGKLVCF